MVGKRQNKQQIFSQFKKEWLASKQISKIKNEPGNIVTNQTLILDVLKLYSKKKLSTCNFFRSYAN